MEGIVSEMCSSKKTREDIWMDDAMRREIGELMGKANEQMAMVNEAWSEIKRSRGMR